MYSKDKQNQSIITYDADGQPQDIEQVQQIIKVEKRHFKKGEFFMQSFELERLIMQENYTITELKVLFSLKNRLDFNNRIKSFRQVDIAKSIGSSQPNVSKAIKKLESDKIIVKDGLDYYFNDTFIKGAGSKRWELI